MDRHDIGVLCLRLATLSRRAVRNIGENAKQRAYWRAAQAENRARKAAESAQRLFAQANPEQVAALRAMVMGVSEDYVKALVHEMQVKPAAKGLTEKEANRIRWRAMEAYADLLKMFAGKQMDREPKRPAGPRSVVVRGWPAEGAKS